MSVNRPSRTRLLDVAGELFIRHSYAGTSLQMIADELGFTKGAIYHHFRTREELLLGLIEPLRVQLGNIVATAEAKSTGRARAELMLTGYAELAADNRALVAVLHGDPGVHAALRANAEWSRLIDRQMALLAGVDPGPGGLIKTAIVMAGFAAASGPEIADIDDDQLRVLLIEAGRRTLGLRATRVSATT